MTLVNSLILFRDIKTMLDWDTINTVLLDMDGTLLDLNFDNYFWQQHVPQCYATLHNIDVKTAQQELIPKFRSREGTIEWYCVDFWSESLGLDIERLKQEVNHLIAIHPHVITFLQALKKNHKRRILVTNAHYKSLMLKMKHTALDSHLDSIISAHEFGIPKENPDFWPKLQRKHSFSKEKTLFIDDSLPVLRSAQNYGIKHLLAIYKPDSQNPIKDVEEFQAIHSFKEIIP